MWSPLHSSCSLVPQKAPEHKQHHRISPSLRLGVTFCATTSVSHWPQSPRCACRWCEACWMEAALAWLLLLLQERGSCGPMAATLQQPGLENKQVRRQTSHSPSQKLQSPWHFQPQNSVQAHRPVPSAPAVSLFTKWARSTKGLLGSLPALHLRASTCTSS